VIRGLFDEDLGAEKGKSLKALLKSIEGQKKVVAMFGGPELVPSSIMKPKKARTDAEVDLEGHERSYTETSPMLKNGKLDHVKDGVKSRFAISGRGCGSGALSTFFQDVGRSIVLYYSEPGELVWDPFAGHNSRMDLCVKAGRNYFGCDLSTPFHAFNVKRADELRKLYPNAEITLHHVDSRKAPLGNKDAAFTITSPPYWDIEYYGDEPEQMSNCQTYTEFIDDMQLVLRRNFKALRPGAYACYFINDFRKKGKMYFYHMDLTRAGEAAGFEAHDIMIVDFGRGFRDVFVNQNIKSRIIPKRHEYMIVFRKPKESQS
jgi:hypothetical protein